MTKTKTPKPSTPVKCKMTVAQLQEMVEKQAEALELLKVKLNVKEGQIMKLEKKVQDLEGHHMLNTSLREVQKRVSEELRSQLTDLPQYTRRYCVVVSGLNKDADEKVEVQNLISSAGSSTIIQDVDKYHRIGRVNDDNKQDLIIRFKSHNAKELFYKARKKLNRVIKVKPSLAPDRNKTLKEAKDLVDDLLQTEDENVTRNYPEYVFADIHGNLKVKMKNGYGRRGQQFFKFNSLHDLREIVDKCNHSEIFHNSSVDSNEN